MGLSTLERWESFLRLQCSTLTPVHNILQESGHL
ncbi:hypothetical protein SAMN04490202_3983 [Pseudomonas reinekei]|uniref:Uncharacterized protein n=1 Tax=Pseudomonas reinekei TaxID=395598 RepID=A0A1H0SAB8_PSERE|nr:hypothetical protein SAMN04490202_3983 [Pseudomonas reinekei]